LTSAYHEPSLHEMYILGAFMILGCMCVA